LWKTKLTSTNLNKFYRTTKVRPSLKQILFVLGKIKTEFAIGLNGLILIHVLELDSYSSYSSYAIQRGVNIIFIWMLGSNVALYTMSLFRPCVKIGY
jgi:hypothetical protein